MKRLLIALGAVALVAVVVIGLRQSDERTPDEDTRAQAPTLAEAQRALAGAPAELAALARQGAEILPGGPEAFDDRLEALGGRPVVVNFWASWCGPCRFEMPYFQAQAARFGKRVAFVGVNERDNRQAALRFLEDYPVPFPSYEDPDNELFARFRLQGMPTTIFYDREGRRTIHQGPYVDAASLAADIRRYALG